MFESVIVPLDGSLIAERALAPARAVVNATQARLVVVSAAAGPESADQLTTELAERTAELGITPDEVRIETFVEPHDLVRKAVDDEPAALVCMASHGRGGLASTMLGSVAKKVMREVRRPILIVGPQCESDVDPTSGTAMVCTDGSRSAEDVVPLAIGWIQAFAMNPWLASVIVPVVTGALPPPPPGPPDVSEASAVHAVADRMIRAGLRPQWDVLHGPDPAAALADRARSLPASLVAMSTHGRTGLAQMALGSVATDVVRHAPCPVLLQRAGLDDFR